MFASMIETLKANPRSIVFTEGHDARILEATARLKADGIVSGGMIPKLDNAFDSISSGVKRVVITHFMDIQASMGTVIEK